jgi:hypothetical protein
LVLLITLPLNYPFWASQRAGRVVEYLPGKCEVLSSKPQYHKRKKKKNHDVLCWERKNPSGLGIRVNSNVDSPRLGTQAGHWWITIIIS